MSGAVAPRQFYVVKDPKPIHEALYRRALIVAATMSFITPSGLRAIMRCGHVESSAIVERKPREGKLSEPNGRRGRKFIA